MLSESVEYAKEAVWGKWKKWVLLVICTIIFPLLYGYVLQIFRGEKPAPELKNWGKLFIDGICYLVIAIVYMIVPLIIFAVMFISAIGGGRNALPLLLVAILVLIILAAIISLISLMGIIRFARTGSMSEAFNFSAIIGRIGNIGWGNYIIALIVLWIVGLAFAFGISLLQQVPVIGWIIYLFIIPAYTIFTARYLTLVYDSAPAGDSVTTSQA